MNSLPERRHTKYIKKFSKPQDEDTLTDLFVSEKRALLAQVNPLDSEAPQIDFIYGLLRHEIRDRTSRSAITNFYQLLIMTREIEESIREQKDAKQSRISMAQKGKENNKTTIRCDFCHAFGHHVSVCRKRAKQDKIPVSTVTAPNPNTLHAKQRLLPTQCKWG